MWKDSEETGYNITRRDFLKILSWGCACVGAGISGSFLLNDESEQPRIQPGCESQEPLYKKYVEGELDDRKLLRILTEKLYENDTGPFLDKDEVSVYMTIKNSKYTPMIIRVARRLKWDEYDALATAFVESSLQHYDRSGNPKRSKTGAYGLMGVKFEAFEEVYNTVNPELNLVWKDKRNRHLGKMPDPYWMRYAKMYPEIVEELRLFKYRSKKKMWELTKYIPEINAKVGISYKKIVAYRAEWDEAETEKLYYAGPGNPQKNSRVCERYYL
ncbi:MAG TPA: hypothetical protein ENG00_01110, partial [Candidatus Aenigmarchaeota archaeon]|nr:hypothetical protein [Candidatus Aenigmarchaeota archaeon]